jgi:hypothetical protein
VVDELRRLDNTQTNSTPSAISKSQTILGQKVVLTPQQLTQLQLQSGQPILQQYDQLMKTPEYKNASDEVKSTVLGNIASQVRTDAKNSMGSGTTSNNPVDITKITKSAQLTLAKDSFDKSGKNYQVVGDTVLRRSVDGTITATPKVKYDYQVGTATMVKQKAANDFQGWLKTAQGQIDSINTQLQDPSIDPLEAIQLQNDAQTISDNAAKYLGYGGFTKGKSAKTKNAAIKSALKSAGVSKITGKVSTPKMTIKTVGKVGTPVVKKGKVGGLSGKIRARVASGASGSRTGSKIGRIKGGTTIRA